MRRAAALTRSLDEPGCGVAAHFTSRVHHERGRLVPDEILELATKFLEPNTNAGGKLRELVRILEIVAAQADHVPARDSIPRGTDINEPYSGPARLAIDERRERDGHEVATLH